MDRCSAFRLLYFGHCIVGSPIYKKSLKILKVFIRSRKSRDRQHNVSFLMKELLTQLELSLSLSYGSWIYKYLCNQWLSTLTF